MLQNLDYTGCKVILYDSSGVHLGSNVIKEYLRSSGQVSLLQSFPASLREKMECKLLILCSPIPHEYSGRVMREGFETLIGLYRGREKAWRAAERHAVDMPAVVDSLFVDGGGHEFHTPLNIKLVDMSGGGLRFSAPGYSFLVGNVIRVRFNPSGDERLLMLKVLNSSEKDTGETEYGCSFVLDGKVGA